MLRITAHNNLFFCPAKNFSPSSIKLINSYIYDMKPSSDQILSSIYSLQVWWYHLELETKTSVV